MADITYNLTFARWLTAKAEPYMDFSDDFLYMTMLSRGVSEDKTLYVDTTDKQRDLCLADMYFAAANSSIKTGTQGESDGGWTHYVAIKNTVNRPGLMAMAKALYEKWGEPFFDMTSKIRMKKLY